MYTCLHLSAIKTYMRKPSVYVDPSIYPSTNNLSSTIDCSSLDDFKDKNVYTLIDDDFISYYISPNCNYTELHAISYIFIIM